VSPGCAYLEYDITRQLKQHITNKIQRQPRQILIPRHPQILCEPLKARIGNCKPSAQTLHSRCLRFAIQSGTSQTKHTIAPVQETQQIQHRHRWKQPQIQLPQQLLLVDRAAHKLDVGAPNRRGGPAGSIVGGLDFFLGHVECGVEGDGSSSSSRQTADTQPTNSIKSNQSLTLT
jgi:hypothetical protein